MAFRSQGIGFVGQEFSVNKNILICAKQFEEKSLSRNEKRTTLKTHLNPVPTIANSKKFSFLKRKHLKTNDRSLKKIKIKFFYEINSMKKYTFLNTEILLHFTNSIYWRTIRRCQ